MSQYVPITFFFMWSFPCLPPLSDHSVSLHTTTPECSLKSLIYRQIQGDKEEVVQSVQSWWHFSPFIEILNSAAIIVNVLKRIPDELLMMMIMTMNPVSAGRLQCFLFYLTFDALQSSFCAIESSDALQRYSKRVCFNDVTESAEK